MLEEPLFSVKKKNGRRKPVEVPEAFAPLADTHGHLTAFRRLDPSEAIVRAALVGVRLLIVPVDPAEDVSDVEEFLPWFERVRLEAASRLEALVLAGEAPRDACALANNTYFVAGVHPYGAKQFMEDASIRERLYALLEAPRCVGVGECGLDIGPWSELSLEEQVPAFREHLRIARERNLPVELHIRSGEGEFATAAHTKALEVLREEGVPAAGCDLHCFTSGPEVMAPFVELGCHVAFGGAATFGRSDEIRAAIAACPESLLLSETDSPYMAPVPLRGQECEPAMVTFNAQNIARVRAEAGLSTVRETYAALWRNACAFFGLDGAAGGELAGLAGDEFSSDAGISLRTNKVDESGRRTHRDKSERRTLKDNPSVELLEMNPSLELLKID